jgi:hypothetical protein
MNNKKENKYIYNLKCIIFEIYTLCIRFHKIFFGCEYQLRSTNHISLESDADRQIDAAKYFLSVNTNSGVLTTHLSRVTQTVR